MGLIGEGDVLRGARVDDGASGEPASTRWRTTLVWLLRILSVLWLAKGLLAWAVIFGIGGLSQPPFEARLLSFQAIVVYFAVIDLVAAVGLWLTSTWGGVLWLLAAISHLLLGFFFPGLLPMTPWFVGSCIGAILAYFLATWAAENESS
ncbi:hypothetical protein ASE63_13375 [Bosea sp. Root381]|uniref:DUF6163 family protein n=1 Tax=Bosea sp. Root381 TaxID=1736524 RepID=UPI0006F50548|nr:DUF6163 family protein [Bosea sp. Root381]KRE17437.1 hypothetical protein ASE63_13375 [Bosea sp. Root381]